MIPLTLVFVHALPTTGQNGGGWGKPGRGEGYEGEHHKLKLLATEESFQNSDKTFLKRQSHYT